MHSQWYDRWRELGARVCFICHPSQSSNTHNCGPWHSIGCTTVLLDEHACVQIARHASGRRNGCGEGDGSRCWCEMVAATDKQGETDTPHRTQQCKLHAFEQQSCWNVCLLRWNRVSTTVCVRRQTNNKPMTNTQTQQQQSSMMTACIIISTIPSQSCVHHHSPQVSPKKFGGTSIHVRAST